MTAGGNRGGLALLGVMLLISSVAATAQTGTIELAGTVSDQLGAVIESATVTLTDATHQSRSTTTDGKGLYRFRTLPPGTYDLEVTFPGFATWSGTLAVKGSRRLVHDVVLRVAVEERIEVVATLEDFRRVTGMTPVGLTLGAEQVRSLPNDPDTMLQVLREMSATTGTADEVSVFVDGQLLAARLPPKEAIQSIRITTNSFAPEFAEPSAGVVEIVTNPAFSDFRGESQGTFNDSALNARNVFEPRKNPTRTQGYSGYLGGPIILGYWSFLGYGGHWARDERVPINTTVVDPARLVAQPFVQSVAVPSRVTSFSLRSDGAFARQILSLEYGRATETRRNFGLDSGRDLPERAYDQDTRDTTARVALYSSIGTDVTGETRLRVHRRTLDESALSAAPAVLVLDTFNAGGNQAALGEHRATSETSFAQTLSYQTERHSVRGGFLFDATSLAEQRLINAGGTFVFGALVDANGQIVASPIDRYLRTLQGAPGYGPSSFAITRGASAVELRDWQASWFVQDDIRLSPTITVSAGVRHDLQKQGGGLDFAPRAGVAWQPGGTPRHTVRAATGLFYTRIPLEIALDPLRYGAAGQRDFVVDNPPFFASVPADISGAASLPTVRTRRGIEAPLTSAVTASYEFQATKTLFASVGYTYRLGRRLLRTINLNAPDELTGERPQPALGPVLAFDASGRRASQHLRFTLRRTLTRVSTFATYVLGTARSDTDGPSTIAAASDREQEYGRAADDERHRFAVGSVVTLPRDVSVSGLLTLSSGRPFNITTGWDNDGDLLFVDRPGFASAGAAAVDTRWGAFTLNRLPGQLMVPRNLGAGPSQFVLNAGIAKLLFVGRDGATRRNGPYVILSASIENVTNRVNYVEFNGVVTSPLFGVANRATNPRRVELSARVGF